MNMQLAGGKKTLMSESWTEQSESRTTNVAIVQWEQVPKGNNIPKLGQFFKTRPEFVVDGKGLITVKK